MFYPADERARVAVDEWLFWQMGNLGPMAGQAHHFRNYTEEKLDYPVERYTNEVNRLYGVMDKQLASHAFIAGDYSIADMACVGWVRNPERRGQDINEFPNLKRWLEQLLERPAVERGLGIGEEKRRTGPPDAEARKILFGQRARR